MGLKEYLAAKRENPKGEKGDVKRLKGVPVKYIYMGAGTISSLIIGLMLLNGGDDNVKSVSTAIQAAELISEELYQRKNVTLDDIETIAGSRSGNGYNASNGSRDRRYKKGDYVENDNAERNPKSKKSPDLDTPINIFSDPRYSVVNAQANGQGRSAFSFNIPTGTILRAYLENEVSTADERVPVVGVIYYTNSDNDTRYLPEGSRIIGRVKETSGNRASVEFKEGIMPDGSRFRLSGIAMTEEYGSRFQGITGIVDREMGRRGGGMIASSALRATRTLTHMTGGSWGSIFAGEMADQSMDGFEDGVDRGLDDYNGPEVILPANTRFQVLVR